MMQKLVRNVSRIVDSRALRLFPNPRRTVAWSLADPQGVDYLHASGGVFMGYALTPKASPLGDLTWLLRCRLCSKSQLINAKYRKSHLRIVGPGFSDISCSCILSRSLSKLGLSSIL